MGFFALRLCAVTPNPGAHAWLSMSGTACWDWLRSGGGPLQQERGHACLAGQRASAPQLVDIRGDIITGGVDGAFSRMGRGHDAGNVVAAEHSPVAAVQILTLPARAVLLLLALGNRAPEFPLVQARAARRRRHCKATACPQWTGSNANTATSALPPKSSLSLPAGTPHPNSHTTLFGAGAWGAGAVALQGDLVAVVDSFKAAAPVLVLPAKFLVAFPLVYHYLGGVRHVFWDKSHYGNMARSQGHEGVRAVTTS